MSCVSPVCFAKPFARLTVVSLAIAAALLPLSGAEFEMPRVFSDGMVLQADRPLPVWGRGIPGTKVDVEFKGRKQETTVDPAGLWRVTLQPEVFSFEPATLTIRHGEAQKLIGDVLVGEVWLCSGQSNMQWSVESAKDGDLEIMAARHPAIRFLNVENVASLKPRFSSDAAWQVCSPDTIRRLTAVGYFFGRDLRFALDRPVGLLNASWGGTPAIAWTRPEVFPKHPLLQQNFEQWETVTVPQYPERLKAHLAELAEWEAAHPNAPKNTPGRPRPPQAPDGPRRPGVLGNGMLATLAPFALRGVIWYQGEADAGWEPDRYDERLAVMFKDWREWWESPELGIGIVQLASFFPAKTEPSDDNWPRLRDAQVRAVEALAPAGLAVAIDVGETDDIHPRNKQDVGRRLARWALSQMYAKPVAEGGPVFSSFEVEGPTLRIHFKNVAPGLATREGQPLAGFTLAGEDRVFYHAEAAIDGETVVLKCSQVEKPVAARYAWQNNPASANLMGKNRLPVGPFRTDRWERAKPTPQPTPTPAVPR